jgi:hypothetical protein
MVESQESLLKAVRHYQQSLDKYTEHRNDSKVCVIVFCSKV